MSFIRRFVLFLSKGFTVQLFYTFFHFTALIIQFAETTYSTDEGEMVGLEVVFNTDADRPISFDLSTVEMTAEGTEQP